VTTLSEREYRPIRDYALIGDAHSAALVASDGSVDWLCWPRFDSPAVFCRLLDKDRGGWFRVGPAGRSASTRSYVEGTNILATVFSTDRGRFRLTDLMPVERLNRSHEGEDIASHYRIIRLVEGLSGEAEVEINFRPTFDYARAETAFDFHDGGAVARHGREALALACPAAFREDPSGGVTARLNVAAGRRVWITLTYSEADDPAARPESKFDADGELEQTLEYWREWSEKTCTYSGPYAQLVRRSALALKLLTYEPTGAIVAAPTTSLPEELGGVRNWDYRFTWLRDSSLILYALQLVGYHEEATDFFEWLDRLCIPCGNELQIMYRIDGGSDLPEVTLDHLEGYRGSRPVRVGNAAFGQKQLDIYGEVIDAAYLYHERMRRPVRPELWDTLRYMADQAAARWREPDHGIWEVRGGLRHFLYSKLLCWVALDRITRMAARGGLPGDAANWERTREEIRRAILTEGYDEKIGAFTQAFGSQALDACALVIPQVGFLPPTDRRVVSTVRRVQEQLTSHGLVYRYLADDGLPGGEATFTLCSFWLVDCLAEAGRLDEARELFERIAGYANDLGLLAEEIDPVSGELLGNYPQGFTHLGLIRSALHIAKAEALGPEERAENPAERAGRMEGAGQVPHAPEGRRYWER